MVDRDVDVWSNNLLHLRPEKESYDRYQAGVLECATLAWSEEALLWRVEVILTGVTSGPTIVMLVV